MPDASPSASIFYCSYRWLPGKNQMNAAPVFKNQSDFRVGFFIANPLYSVTSWGIIPSFFFVTRDFCQIPLVGHKSRMLYV